MATFTVTLKRVIEIEGGEVNRVNGNAVLTGCDIGISSYTIPAITDYKPRLDGLIIDRFWNREIGLETIEQFRFNMRRKLNEIMPYYNTVYGSTKIAFDPLSTVDIRTVVAGDQTNESTSSENTTNVTHNLSKSRAVNSDTPQTMLSGNEDYASSGADVTSTGDVDSTAEGGSTASSSGESNAETHMTGYQGAASDLIIRYREALLNVDLMVLDELEELFMSVWDDGSSFTRGYTL